MIFNARALSLMLCEPEITLSRLAKEIGTSKGTLSELKHGKTIPSVVMLAKVLTGLHRSITEVFTLEPGDPGYEE